MTTDEGRKKQIEQALAARSQKPASEQYTHPLPWRGSEGHFPLIDLPLDVPLLNADSHRIRAELEVPEYDFIRKERMTDQAQRVLADLWKKAHRKFDKLKESLHADGQTEPGVITRAGVVINGNTRLVVLRELQDPDKQWLRVAVLDSDATPRELANLELGLQIRDPVRDPYKLSNELLFIEDMAREYSMSDEQIALALGWNPSKPAIGKKKVAVYRRILQLIREMQRRDPRLPITFFDEKLQHLKELEQKYSDLAESGETDDAGLLLETWLIVARSGFSSVHLIRPVTQSPDFLADYLLPRLGEQELIGDRADDLVHGKRAKSAAVPGLDDLDPEGGDDESVAPYDVRPLLRLVESTDDKVTLPGGDGEKVEAEGVKAAIRAAIDGAINDQRAEGRAEDALNAPVEALRSASRELKAAIATFSELRGTKEFERQVRGAFEYQVKQLRKYMKTLEDLIAGKEKVKAGK